MKSKILLVCTILLVIISYTSFSNPIPVPVLEMEEEWIDVTISEKAPENAGSVRKVIASVDGTYPMENISLSDIIVINDPLPADSTNIIIQLDGTKLRWEWTQDTYPTILPEWPELPEIQFSVSPVPDTFTLRAHYEHGVIKRSNELVFLYPLGCWEGQPVQAEKMTAHTGIGLPSRFLPKGVFLDYDPQLFRLNRILYVVDPGPDAPVWQVSGDYESEPGKSFDKDYILTFIDRWQDPLTWYSQPPDMADGLELYSSIEVNSLLPVDDFMIPNTGFVPPTIGKIRFWGGYPRWYTDNPDVRFLDIIVPRPEYFTIRIFECANMVDEQDSVRPVTLVYRAQVREFTQGYFGMVVRAGDDTSTLPNSYTYEHKFEYNVELPTEFTPIPGHRYWLSIMAGPVEGDPAWAWTTSPVNENTTIVPVTLQNDVVVSTGTEADIMSQNYPAGNSPQGVQNRPLQMAFALSSVKPKPVSGIRYKLIAGSSLIIDYNLEPPEENPPALMVPISGDFLLYPANISVNSDEQVDSLFSHFLIKDLEFRSTDNPDQYWGHNGNGRYLLKKKYNKPGMQRMTLTVNIDRSAPIPFDSGLVEIPPGAQFPWIKITLQSIDPQWSQYTLNFTAVPWPKILFSTEVSFTSGNLGNRVISDGDLLTSRGQVLRTNKQLLSLFRPKPPEQGDYGLDTIIGPPLPNLKYDVRKGRLETWFSTEIDVNLQSSSNILAHGDLAGDTGWIVRNFSDLVSPFSPMPPVTDMGLDAACLGWIKPIYESYDNTDMAVDINTLYPASDAKQILLYSFENSFFSESLGVTINHGDLVSENGKVYKTNKDLTANFNPIEIPDEGFGLDAVYIWPHGEIWFSVETGFEDRNLGQVGDGDILSNRGNIVMKNLALMAPFQPLERLADFGLDGLWVDIKRPFEACGVLVQGVEGVLFETEDGKRYILDNYGHFRVNDYVWVSGTLNPDCVTIIMEGEGCIEDNDIMSCKEYPAKRLYTGDVDGNEIVDIVDALLIAQKFVGLNPANYDERPSDTNNDGVSDIIDALLTAQYYVGLNPASWQD